MTKGRALIIGGGIGGLSAGIALRGIGWDVDLIDRERQWTALGAGLTYNGATARAFRALGVLDEVLSAGVGHGTSRTCDKDGNVLAESVTEPLYGPGLPNLGGILRPVLHEIMKARGLSLGLDARTGVTAEALELHPDRTSVSFSDGTSGTYDLVVGADGLMSRTRELVFPEAPAPSFTGQGAWRAVLRRPAELEASELWFGPEFKAGLKPVSQNQMYLFALVNEPDNPWIKPEDLVPRLREKLQGFGGLVAMLRDELGPDSQIVYRPLETIVVPDPWFRHRVLLIGDAAHATTPHAGYGAGLAAEDGLILAELLDSGLTIDLALRAFMARRYRRCADIVNDSVRLGQLEIDRAPLSEQRELSARIFARIQELA